MPGEQQVDQPAEDLDAAAVEHWARQLEQLAAQVRRRAPRRIEMRLTNEIVDVSTVGTWRERAWTGAREVVVEVEWGPGEW